jgi:hypothetical protein
MFHRSHVDFPQTARDYVPENRTLPITMVNNKAEEGILAPLNSLPRLYIMTDRREVFRFCYHYSFLYNAKSQLGAA